MFDLKTQPWHIKVNSPEESRAAQEWLFSQGVFWCDGEKKLSALHSTVLSNYWNNSVSGNIKLNKIGFMYSLYGSEFDRAPVHELKLSFDTKLTVSGQKFPEILTEQQKKIRELEQTIAKAQAQIQELKGE